MPDGATGADRPPVTRPRPGHADLAGFVKYGHEDMRNVLERASARETAARVAVGAIARQLLRTIGAEIVSHVVRIGSAAVADPLSITFDRGARHRSRRAAALRRRGGRATDDRRDRQGARSRRYDGRHLRGHRPRPPARPWQLRALGSQARWTSRPGADVDPRDQGCRDRTRTSGGRGARLPRSRRDSPGPRFAAAKPQSRSPVRPTTREASKAA